VVSPSTAPDLAATGYFFGREIQKTVGVAVGLVVTAVGGTTVASWLDPATVSANSGIRDTDKGNMWDAWVAPVAGYGIRGTVWIQGEQNCNAEDAPSYADRFKLIIKGWRIAWGQDDFPFYYGQLSSTSGTPDPNNVSYVAQVREGQRLGLSLPNTAMSVNFDYTSGTWHFPNKPEAGRRLALPAKALLYGQTALVYSGPMFASKIVDGNRIKLLFNHIGGGLVAQGGSLSGFAIAAASGSWVWGNAVISGDTVIVSSTSIAQPARVRYAWSDKPAATLFNNAGLPASPFTTESPLLPSVQIADANKFRPAIHQTVIYKVPANGAMVTILGQRVGAVEKVACPQLLVSGSARKKQMNIRRQ
jgi:sialate O-acetylesterase